MEVFEDRIAIAPKGVLGFLNKGLKGTKEIPFSSIVAVRFREAGAFLSKYLQFTIPGGHESRKGLLSATQDENTFTFAGTANNAMAKQIREYIDTAMRARSAVPAHVPHASIAQELQSLAKLKADGILSEQEFQIVKSRLLA